MTEFFDVVYQDQKCMAPTDLDRCFFNINVESLDAPDLMPAGSTRAFSGFHATSVFYRF